MNNGSRQKSALRERRYDCRSFAGRPVCMAIRPAPKTDMKCRFAVMASLNEMTTGASFDAVSSFLLIGLPVLRVDGSCGAHLCIPPAHVVVFYRGQVTAIGLCGLVTFVAVRLTVRFTVEIGDSDEITDSEEFSTADRENDCSRLVFGLSKL